MGLIKLRTVPVELHRRLKAEAATAGMSLELWCICRLGEPHVDIPRPGSKQERQIERSRNGARLPVLQKAESVAERLYPVQPLRDKLVERRDEPSELPELRPASVAPGSCPHGKRNAAYCRATGGIC